MRSNLFYIFIIGTVLYVSRHQVISLLNARTVPATLTQTSECLGKKKCGIIYLAPWCPACNSIIPQLKIMLKNAESHPDFGLKIIVGRGRAAGDNFLKAKEIGEKVVVDDDGIYASTLNVTYFPTMLVVDGTNKVELKDQEAMHWLNESFAIAK